MNAHTNLATSVAQPDQALPTYDAKALTKNGILAQIMLDQQTYFLRITRAGKLILTK